MTLISRFLPGGHPVYLGDLLISVPADISVPPLDIPAADNINALLPKGAPRKVKSLVQKLNLLHDRLIVAWAGSVYQARVVLRDLQQLALSGIISLRAIGDLLARLPDSETNDLYLLGTLITPEGDRSLLEHFNVGDLQTASVNGTDLVATGTGANAFLNLAPQVLTIPPPFAEPERTPSWAVGVGCMAAANFIGHEILNGSNILDSWGGGFEIATFDQGKFRKIGNILHVFWRLESDARGVRLALIPKFIKYDYLDDALCIQKYECKFVGDAAVSVADQHYLICFPLVRSSASTNYSIERMPSLNSEHVCHYVLEQSGAALSIVDWSQVRFVIEQPEGPGFLRIGIREDFKRTFFQAIESHTKKPISSMVML